MSCVVITIVYRSFTAVVHLAYIVLLSYGELSWRLL